MTLVPVDTSNAVAVSDYLSKAREWLATAVEMTGPEQIAAAKAEIATAAEATKQLNLSKEIQDDAREMVRRAEYALGKAIRKGQEEGTVAMGNGGDRRSNVLGTNGQASPADFASDVELYDRPSQGKAGILSIADNATPEQFEQALTEARAEGNLSRANVARKVTPTATTPTTGRGRAGSGSSHADHIAELAARGYSSRQIAPKLGLSEEYVRRLIREYEIDVPADKAVRNTRRINSTQIVENTATALEGLVAGVDLIDYDDVDPLVASQWADSLNDSLKKLRGFANQLRKATQ